MYPAEKSARLWIIRVNSDVLWGYRQEKLQKHIAQAYGLIRADGCSAKGKPWGR